MQWILICIFSSFFLLGLSTTLFTKSRKYQSVNSVASSYDSWTNDRLLENLWGEHIHLGYYEKPRLKKDFMKAKIDFVHELVHWSGLNKLPKGSRILDVGCGIGGSARILSNRRTLQHFHNMDCLISCFYNLQYLKIQDGSIELIIDS